MDDFNRRMVLQTLRRAAPTGRTLTFKYECLELDLRWIRMVVVAFGYRILRTGCGQVVLGPMTDIHVWSSEEREFFVEGIRNGFMNEHGINAMEKATYHGTWAADRDPNHEVVPQDLLDAIAFHPLALGKWDRCLPEVRSAIIGTVRNCTDPRRRQRIINDTVEYLATEQLLSTQHPVERALVFRRIGILDSLPAEAI